MGILLIEKKIDNNKKCSFIYFLKYTFFYVELFNPNISCCQKTKKNYNFLTKFLPFLIHFLLISISDLIIEGNGW